MIRADVLFDFTRLDNLERFAANFAPNVIRASRQAFNQRIRLPFLGQLRKTPRRRYWTGSDFVSDAQRRAFFAKTGGKAYQRTGELAAGWSVNLTVSDNAIAISASNKTPYEKWVTGSRQQFGHAKTGWGKHEDVFDVWRRKTIAVITDEIEKLLLEAIR